MNTSQINEWQMALRKRLTIAAARVDRAFTLTEILIVISIIVIALALAVPAFNVITGGKSEASATNKIGAMLSLARQRAMAMQKRAGVMFYKESVASPVMVALVEESQTQSTVAYGTTKVPEVFLALTPDTDVVALPKGVGVNVVDDDLSTGNPPVRKNDAYIGFNHNNGNPIGASSDTVALYGGVILFDAQGLLVSKTVAYQTNEGTKYSAMGRLLYKRNTNEPLISSERDVIPVATNGGEPFQEGLFRSSLGFVLYDRATLESTSSLEGGSAPWDLQVEQTMTPYAGSDEEAREKWLDKNATPVLINRYAGTLVKAE